ncbi:type II toxin-antitoxin system RelE/ParE family toxin [Sandaracinobacteroides sp. A072]|uniref:type II toxin-antitoxin system RelE/ParE family toxin n=1 Tax=Sandaracinobacteroides sp. A072 TaxID=3461146 RepID=UPI0040412D16
MSGVRLTRMAEEDLARIFESAFRTFGFLGMEVAISNRDGFKAAFMHLLHFPTGGQIQSQIEEGVRAQPFRNHVIYYSLDSDGLLVLRILPSELDMARAA